MLRKYGLRVEATVADAKCEPLLVFNQPLARLRFSQNDVHKREFLLVSQHSGDDDRKRRSL